LVSSTTGGVIAIVDGGIQPDHPDLNVVGGVNCLAGGDPNDWADRDGHGTFAAGLVGARDNDFGVAGVSPGARLFAVRAIDAVTGLGSDADVICGLDWIAGTRYDNNPNNDIAVANMSLCGTLRQDR
jgi:subtilisin family serine protease